MDRVAGKVCLVTGGASGLGKACVTALIAEGAEVVFTDRNEKLGSAVAAEIGSKVTFFKHDVSNEDEWRSLIKDVMDRFGRLNVLINNAGVSKSCNIEEETLENWRAMHAVNSEGVFLGCKHAIPALHKSGGGSIVNVVSTVINQPQSFNPAYTASKGSADALTRSVAVYCMDRGYNIRCNSVQPHAVDTPLLQKTLDSLFADASPDARAKMKMKLGSPIAVANTVLFLASDESSDLNGSALRLDRGSSLVLAAGPE